MNCYRLVVLATVVLVGGAHAADDTVAQFLSIPWVLVTLPEKVDHTVMGWVTDRFGDDKRLAGPNEPFEATDIVSGRPARRFLVAGQCPGHWFVAYEHGGRGHHVDLVAFDTTGDVPRLEFVATGWVGVHDDIAGLYVSLEDLRAALTNGKLKAGALCDRVNKTTPAGSVTSPMYGGPGQ